MCTHQDQGWISSHPKVCEIKAQGIDNSTQTHCAILTYFDLTEGTSLPFMNPLYRNRLKISTKCLCDMHVYEDSLSDILPLPASTELSMERIKHYFAALHPRASHMELEPSRMEEGPFCELIPKLTLALVDSDSTVVYYNVFDGMQPPKDASESKT
ncbi:tRNA-splicing endonuclease subunit Sen15-like isoform X2 [Halichondria panicea]|uniref:tRNA-splicing endonuclease subunit Sen15-like isoform X2 n=1 Tax=Halichondria panicea TaxID=6063 RepID=UPI00312B3664